MNWLERLSVGPLVWLANGVVTAFLVLVTVQAYVSVSSEPGSVALAVTVIGEPSGLGPAGTLINTVGFTLFTVTVVVPAGALALSESVTTTLIVYGALAGRLSRYWWLTPLKVRTPAPRATCWMALPSPQSMA